MDFSSIIEPIARLNRDTLAELILRMENPVRRAVCYSCWDPESALRPYGGRLLCDPRIIISRARGGMARWAATQNLFVADLKKGETKMMKRIFWALFLFVLLLYAFPLFAYAMQLPGYIQTPPVPAPPPSNIAADVAIIAGIVASLLQGLKEMIPQINGKLAVVLSIVLSLATTYAAAPPASIMSVQFLLTSIAGALGANGIYSLLKKP